MNVTGNIEMCPFVTDPARNPIGIGESCIHLRIGQSMKVG